MERQFQCPSCGAGNAVTNPGILMKVCEYCKAALYWDKDSALRVGNKSFDLPQSPRFRTGATGKLGGKVFRVLGRLVYEHDAGFWQEWFIEMENGAIQWLTEDEGELFLENPVNLNAPIPDFEQLRPGLRIDLNGKVGVIEELGHARLIGGEGQIPFQVELGQTYPYADGAGEDGAFSFGIEYDNSLIPHVFMGRALNLKGAKAKSQARAEPERKDAENIRCTSCGKPFEKKPVDTAKMIVCESCGAGLELDQAELKVVSQNDITRIPHFTFKLDDALTFDNIKYAVMGRMQYLTSEFDRYEEYCLYHRTEGYLRLTEERGHFVLSRVSHNHPVMPEAPSPKDKVQVADVTFKVFESATDTLVYVDGALPWVATVGETTQFVHMIKPPECLDYEITNNELELWRGEYVEPETMAEAAKDIPLPERRGVFSCQPFRAKYSQGLWILGAVFLLLNLVLLVIADFTTRKTEVLRETISAKDYTAEYFTKTFEVKRNSSVLEIRGHAPVRNSWVFMDFAVVNAADEVVSDFGDEMTRYEGEDEGEHWSEGSGTFQKKFRVDKKGTYKLLMHGQGGSGEAQGPARNEDVGIVVYQNVVIPWYLWVAALISLFFLLLEPLLRWSFSRKRWSGAGTDDDDDDD